MLCEVRFSEANFLTIMSVVVFDGNNTFSANVLSSDVCVDDMRLVESSYTETPIKLLSVRVVNARACQGDYHLLRPTQ